jgi:hypothetical protein
MADQSEKGAFIEKITFAVLPLLFSCVVYLMTALSSLSHEVTILNSKISLVVTSDNKQATNTMPVAASQSSDGGNGISANRLDE